MHVEVLSMQRDSHPLRCWSGLSLQAVPVLRKSRGVRRGLRKRDSKASKKKKRVLTSNFVHMTIINKGQDFLYFLNDAERQNLVLVFFSYFIPQLYFWVPEHRAFSHLPP